MENASITIHLLPTSPQLSLFLTDSVFWGHGCDRGSLKQDKVGGILKQEIVTIPSTTLCQNS